MERQLCTIARVLAKQPIEGADLIERLQVKGWNLVSGKDNFQVGDLCAYFEVDSFIPQEPEFEFLRKGSFAKNHDGTEGFRLKTIKLRGQVSQGLALPLKELQRFFFDPECGCPHTLYEGMDITDMLGVKKYEAPIPAELSGKAKGMFPGFVPKTDEERVQNLQPMLDQCAGMEAYIAQKIDGASMTMYMKDLDFGVCTRNTDLLRNEDNSMWKIAIALGIEDKLRNSPYTLKNVAIQGEIYGEGIQKNKLGMKGQHFAAFNVYDIDNQFYLTFNQFMTFCRVYDIPTVRIFDDNAIIHNDIEKWVELSKQAYPNGSKAEGIVVRSKLNARFNGERVSFKVINPEFLLKHGE